MAAIILDDHKELFRSEADFEKFVSILGAAGGSRISTSLWVNRRYLATLMPHMNPQEAVRERMDIRIAEEPELLDEIINRLKEDDFVEWE